jgi:hypothetical protein
MRNQRLTYCCRYLQSEEETEHKTREKESSFSEEKLLRMRKCLGKRERVPPSLVDRLRVVTDFIVDCEENWKRKLPGIGYVL